MVIFRNYSDCDIFMFSSALFNRTNNIHMTNSMSWRLNILCKMFKVIALFIITLFTLLYVWVGILFTHGMQLQDGIISLRRGVLANKTSLTPPLFFYWSVNTKPGKWVVMHICVSGLDFATSSILIFDFGMYCFSVYCTNNKYLYQ